MPPRTRNSPFAASRKGRKTKKARTSKEPTPPPIEEVNPSPPSPIEETNPSPPSPIEESNPSPPSPIEELNPRPPSPLEEPHPSQPSPIEEPNPSPPSVQETDSPPPPQDNEEETNPFQPKKFYFPHTEFGKTIKIASKCEVSETIKALDVLGRDEKMWFINHPQFRHIWHMPREKNHKLMGMWLTLLRTLVIDKGWEMCWFVVNGVPIRYSLREHGLITGLDCQHYPRYYKELGSDRFVKRQFGRVKDITVADVRNKLKDMIADGDRKKMALLLFLSTVLGSKRVYGAIDPFFLQIVDDIKACETFPWGRYTFEQSLSEIFHMMEHYNGTVKPKATWCFPGFIIPLEVKLITILVISI